jgi:hypothetical protein
VGSHDDIVDMLGLFGQLLETVNAPNRPKVDHKPQSGYRTVGSRASANSIKVI